MHPFLNQMAIDEALAMALQYDDSEPILDDAAIARQLQREEENRMKNFLSEDEALAKQLQAMEGASKNSLLDDEKLARLLQDEESQNAKNHGSSSSSSTNGYDDISNKFQDLQVGSSSSFLGEHRHNHDHNDSSSSSSDGYHQSEEGIDLDHHHEDINPDNMSYEEINELQENVGHVSKGLPKEKISRLPTHKYGAKTSWWSLKNSKDKDSNQQCSICQTDYEKGEMVMTLPCSHQYHQQCIERWLEQSKDCCVCKTEVSV